MLLNSAQLRGFFEGDGGIQIRVDKRKNGLSFRPQAKFGQTTKNAQILEWCKESLQANIAMAEYDETDASWFVFPFNSDIGKRFIQMYLKNKPVNPGTLKDFLIALLIYQYQTERYIPFESESAYLLQNKPYEERERIEFLTLLWLRYQRSASRETKKTLPISHYHEHVNATPDEISSAERLGNELLLPISMEVNDLVSNLENNKIQICADYVAYYHVADGSLSFNFHKRRLAGGRQNIKIDPRWTISDDLLAKPLLECIAKQYNFSGYQPMNNQNCGYIHAKGWARAKEVVIPFFKDKQLHLPDVIANKVSNFIEVCGLHSNPNTFKDAQLFRSYVRKAYFCNPDKGKRSEQTFSRDYEKLMENLISDRQIQ
uniref:LAGLIDADG homing endonuclease n=1 Tax=Dunaliella salina TaxID=3046 RepID=C9D8Q6_DUNSA|nr:LAGLIDADG homing endonuclease [Dunaliella salina]YP_005089848.1 LAGLIDADG homing endonuclease [Dunaliella salina]ACS95070.1 LAGLIDADG homing endonuclease [Dunaliella salina]ACS95109.1 LAGLIDADG homing endonuclease [Dunaliella salina]